MKCLIYAIQDGGPSLPQDATLKWRLALMTDRHLEFHKLKKSQTHNLSFLKKKHTDTF